LPILLSSVAFLLIAFQAPTRVFGAGEKQWFRSSVSPEEFLLKRLQTSTNGNISPLAEYYESVKSNAFADVPVSVVGQKHATIKYAIEIVDALQVYDFMVGLADLNTPKQLAAIADLTSIGGGVDLLYQVFDKGDVDDFLSMGGLDPETAGSSNTNPIKRSLNPMETVAVTMARAQEYSDTFDQLLTPLNINGEFTLDGGNLPQEVGNLIQGKTMLSIGSASGCSSLFCSVYKARMEHFKNRGIQNSSNKFAFRILTEDFITSNGLSGISRDLFKNFQDRGNAQTVANLERMMAQTRSLTETARPAAKKASVCTAYDSASPPSCMSWSP
jgi:hypothetical protein